MSKRGFKAKDLTGKTFGLLTANFYLGNGNWDCTCSKHPNKSVVVASSALNSGKTKSCGCIRVERFKTHGLHKTKEYRVWDAIKTKCYNKKNPQYKNYGGRGVVMSEEWKGDFLRFLKDMGNCPSDKNSIDRIDNNGNYTKENCVWVTRAGLKNNFGRKSLITFNNKTQSLSLWSKEVGVHPDTISKRLNRGWSKEDALTVKPVRRKEYEN